MLKFHNPLWDNQDVRKKAETITKAIATKSVLSLNYLNGQTQEVEPFALGIHKESGKHVMQCVDSLFGGEIENIDNWLLLDLDNLHSVHTTTSEARAYLKNYFPLSDEMDEIIASIAEIKKII